MMSEDLGFRFTWYGHSTVFVESEAGTAVLFDPWFGHPLATTGPQAIDRCDVMLVTHGHFDHLGAAVGDLAAADSLAIARRTRPAWPAIHELSLWLEAQKTGAEIVGMNLGGTVEVRGLRVTMVPALHSAGDWLPDTRDTIYLGEPAGFVVELENGRRLYHAGDTALFGDMRLIGEMYRPDVAFLPIGGHFTMDPTAAARAVELLGCATVVPIHYGTFPILAGDPDQLRTELADIGLDDVTVVSPGRGEAVG
jgi:L-ascorbate metabolism protein UlaG (beta-lactamase superfamily)